jgi:hypothetical protein
MSFQKKDCVREHIAGPNFLMNVQSKYLEKICTSLCKLETSTMIQGTNLHFAYMAAFLKCLKKTMADGMLAIHVPSPQFPPTLGDCDFLPTHSANSPKP